MFKKILLIVAAMLLLLCGCSAAEPEEEMPVDYDLNRDCVVYYEAVWFLPPERERTGTQAFPKPVPRRGA